MNKESALKHLEMYLLNTHNLCCNQRGLKYWDEYIRDEVERLQNGPHREVTELELHRIAKLGGVSPEDVREGNRGAFIL